MSDVAQFYAMANANYFPGHEKSSQAMSLFDSYFDPEQFRDSGGLVGRLLSLQGQQGQYQPSAGFDPQFPGGRSTTGMPQAPLSMPASWSTSPNSVPAPSVPQTPDSGEIRNIAIGSNFLTPQFGKTDVSRPLPPPFDLGDHLSAGFQSGTHTPVGNPKQDLNSQYRALRPLLGNRNAMLAIVHPEAGKTLIAKALADQTKSGTTGDANPSDNGQAGRGDETSSITGGQPPGLSKAAYFEFPANAN